MWLRHQTLHCSLAQVDDFSRTIQNTRSVGSRSPKKYLLLHPHNLFRLRRQCYLPIYVTYSPLTIYSLTLNCQNFTPLINHVTFSPSCQILTTIRTRTANTFPGTPAHQRGLPFTRRSLHIAELFRFWRCVNLNKPDYSFSRSLSRARLSSCCVPIYTRLCDPLCYEFHLPIPIRVFTPTIYFPP